ncbi:MAG: carbohydrate ABC transporter permease [Treponema sp.]|jgi:multiple sugar transport system permease protein|nr:carbohydrate ABC transporter permease [Treponema sp.]
MLRDRSLKSRVFNLVLNIAVGLLLAVMIVPIVFMISASLMPVKDIFAMPFRWIPRGIYWQNYYTAIAGPGVNPAWTFPRNVLNSIYVAGLTMIFAVIVSALAGYGFSKFKFKGRNIVFLMIMGRMMIPFEAIMIPMYVITIKIGLQNTYAGLILPSILDTFGVFLLRQYLISFPEDMLDAGRIDGLGEPGIFLKLVFVNCTPALATAGILVFRGQWDNLLWPLLIIQRDSMKTIPPYLAKMVSDIWSDEGAMLAVATMSSIPIIILFLIFSKYFLGGSTVYSASKE